MACCLTAPSHYLHQSWLIISKVLWHSSEGIVIRRTEYTNQYNKIENYILRIAFRSPRGQRVKVEITLIAVEPCLIEVSLPHWGRNNMAAIFSTTLSMHCRGCQYSHFDSNFTVFCSCGCNHQQLVLVQIVAWPFLNKTKLRWPIATKLLRHMSSLAYNELIMISLINLLSEDALWLYSKRKLL